MVTSFNNELMAIILESIHVGVLLVNADDHNILGVNSQAENLLGRSREELLQSKCDEQICNICTMIYSYDDAKEVIINRPDGSKKYIKLYVTEKFINASNIYIITLIDVTDNREVEELLIDSWGEAKTLLQQNILAINTNED